MKGKSPLVSSSTLLTFKTVLKLSKDPSPWAKVTFDVVMVDSGGVGDIPLAPVEGSSPTLPRLGLPPLKLHLE